MKRASRTVGAAAIIAVLIVIAIICATARQSTPALTSTGSVCKLATLKSIPGCVVAGKICRRGSMFQVELSDLHGTSETVPHSATSDWSRTAKEAAHTALERLFSSVRGCNCRYEPSLTLGACTAAVEVCLLLSPFEDYNNDRMRVHVFVQVINPTISREFDVVSSLQTPALLASADYLYRQVTKVVPSCVSSQKGNTIFGSLAVLSSAIAPGPEPSSL